MRRIVALVLIALGLLLALGQGRGLASIVLGKSKTTTRGLTDSVSAIVLDVGNGDVEIKTGSRATVRKTEHWVYSRPFVKISEANGVVTVSARCPGSWFNRCWVDFVATVPAATRSSIKTTNGDVEVSDLAGPPVTVVTTNGDVELTSVEGPNTKVRTTNGDINAHDVRGPVQVTTKNGDVQLRDVAGPIEAETTNGDVEAMVTMRTQVALSTTNGDVDLTVPAGSYALDLKTKNGDVTKDGIEESPESPYSLGVQTNNGDITISTSGG